MVGVVWFLLVIIKGYSVGGLVMFVSVFLIIINMRVLELYCMNIKYYLV